MQVLSKKKKIFYKSIIYFLLLVVTLFVFLPIMWMVSTSLKTEKESLAIPPTWLPQKISFFGFKHMWEMKPFLTFFMNSILTAGPTAIFATLIGALSAYSISRFKFKGRKMFLGVVLFTQMVPGVLLVGPYFKVLNNFGLYNTRIGLMLGYIAVALPFCTYTLKGYMDSIPIELDQAALVDGCNRLEALFKVVLPLALPGIVATGVFAFLLAWNDLLWALSLTSSESMSTVTLGIANSVGEYRVIWPALMAAALIASIPSIFLYSFLQKYLVTGMAKGSVKG